jgi:hypothetical protein
MKTQKVLAVVVSLSLGICFQASAESLSTADGTTYNHITTKRVDPDGLYIEYTPDGGGLGMSKVKFSRLSEDQRKQFGYDEAKARDFEAQHAKAMEAWQAENVRMEKDSRARMDAQVAQANQDEALQTQRILALAQLKQAEAELARASGGNSDSAGYGYGTLGDGGFAVAIPSTGHAPPPITRHAPIAREFIGTNPGRGHAH